jgi:hypothetical protein
VLPSLSPVEHVAIFVRLVLARAHDRNRANSRDSAQNQGGPAVRKHETMRRRTGAPWACCLHFILCFLAAAAVGHVPARTAADDRLFIGGAQDSSAGYLYGGVNVRSESTGTETNQGHDASTPRTKVSDAARGGSAFTLMYVGAGLGLIHVLTGYVRVRIFVRADG